MTKERFGGGGPCAALPLVECVHEVALQVGGSLSTLARPGSGRPLEAGTQRQEADNKEHPPASAERIRDAWPGAQASLCCRKEGITNAHR